MPDVLAAADALDQRGYLADVVCVTSADLLYRALHPSDGPAETGGSLRDLFGDDSARPMITVLDGHPHTLAFLAAGRPAPFRALGVAEFGQSGDLPDLYRHFGIDAESITSTAIDLAQTR